METTKNFLTPTPPYPVCINFNPALHHDLHMHIVVEGSISILGAHNAAITGHYILNVQTKQSQTVPFQSCFLTVCLV